MEKEERLDIMYVHFICLEILAWNKNISLLKIYRSHILPLLKYIKHHDHNFKIIKICTSNIFRRHRTANGRRRQKQPRPHRTATLHMQNITKYIIYKKNDKNINSTKKTWYIEIFKTAAPDTRDLRKDLFKSYVYRYVYVLFYRVSLYTVSLGSDVF